MSYYTHISVHEGDLRIEPPLTWAEIRQADDGGRDWTTWDRGADDVGLFKVVVRSEDVDTDEGIPWIVLYDGGLNHTGPEDVAAEFEAFFAAFPGHDLTVVVAGRGEEWGDLWRVYVRDRQARASRAQITYPDPFGQSDE